MARNLKDFTFIFFLSLTKQSNLRKVKVKLVKYFYSILHLGYICVFTWGTSVYLLGVHLAGNRGILVGVIFIIILNYLYLFYQ